MTKNEHVVVIADDDEDDVLLMTAALQEVGFSGQVKHVKDGVELLDDLSNSSAHADLILLDLQMPVMGGHEALEHLRRDSRLKGVPIVVHSTSSNSADISFCYRKGANSYIVKPANYDALLSNMKNIIEYWFKTATLP